ncbi:MAG: hypothetical protein AB7U20_06895 [Planctomycetaceae bacterium]
MLANAHQPIPLLTIDDFSDDGTFIPEQKRPVRNRQQALPEMVEDGFGGFQLAGNAGAGMPLLSLDDFDDYGNSLPLDRRPVRNRSDVHFGLLPPNLLNAEGYEPVDAKPMPVLNMMDFGDNGEKLR